MLERKKLIAAIAAVVAVAAAVPISVCAYTPPAFVPLTLKKPDLTIGGVKESAMLPCKHGLPGMRFLAKVENVGKLDYNPAPANQALVVHGPSHSVYADLPFISAGGSAVVELDYTPHSVESAHYPDAAFNFVVNPSHRIIESNYDNNTYLKKVALTGPFCPSAAAMPKPPTPEAAPSH
jgi:hypothetical protein